MYVVIELRLTKKLGGKPIFYINPLPLTSNSIFFIFYSITVRYILYSLPFHYL